MKDLRSLVLLALAALISAQSAPDFPVQVTTNLRVDYQSSSTSVKAGALISQNDVLGEPTIDGPADASSTIDYMVFMIDQDVTSPTHPSTRVQFLHWYQPNLSGASEVLFADSGAQNFTSATPLTYVAPTPPGGDIAHSYTVIMYHQPKGFSIPSGFTSFFQDKSDLSNRLDFDIKGFADAGGLGEPVGANWFQVQNTTQPAGGSTTSSSSSSSSSKASSTTKTSTSTSTSTSTEASTTTEETTTTSTSTEVESTSTSESSSEVDSTTTPSVGASTSTAIVTASQTLATASSSTPSASASITPATGSGAGLVDVHGSLRALILSLVVSAVGAGLWLL